MVKINKNIQKGVAYDINILKSNNILGIKIAHLENTRENDSHI